MKCHIFKNVYLGPKYSTQFIRVNQDYPLYIVTCNIIYLATSPMSYIGVGDNDANGEDKKEKKIRKDSKNNEVSARSRESKRPLALAAALF